MNVSKDSLEGYLHVHGTQLQTIAGLVGNLTQDSTQTILATREGLEEAQIIIDTTPEAEEAPEYSVAEANSAITFLLGAASMSLLSDYFAGHPNTKENPWNHPDNPTAPFVPYTKAVYIAGSRALATVTLEGTITRLEGLNNIPDFYMQDTSATIEDTHLKQSLEINASNGLITGVHYNVKPKRDELLRRCLSLLGQDCALMLPLLGGHFADEDELNSQLNDIWIGHQSQSTEEEIGPLLEEVRNRAFAAQEARQLGTQGDLHIPTTEKLDEFEALLRQ